MYYSYSCIYCQVWDRRWCLYRLGRLHLTCCWRPYLQYLCRDGRVPLKVKMQLLYHWLYHFFLLFAPHRQHTENNRPFLQSKPHSSKKRFPAYQLPDGYVVVPTKKSIASSARTESTESTESTVSDESNESRKSRTTSGSRVSSISGITTTTKTSATNAYVWPLVQSRKNILCFWKICVAFIL